MTAKPPYSSALTNPALTNEEELYWLALRMVPGLGTRRTVQLLDRLRTPRTIFRASQTELEAAGVTGAVARSITSGCSFKTLPASSRKCVKPARR